MNLENKMPKPGKVLLGCLLGIVFAALSPLMMVAEIFWLMMVISIPAIGLLLLYRWAGTAPAVFAAMLHLVLTAKFLGGTFMWIAFFSGVLPLVLLLKCEKKHFYTQVKVAIGAFGIGMFLSVVMLYLNFGGNMIERVLMELPKSLREIPVEMLTVAVDNFSASVGREVPLEEFYKLFDELIASQVPAYQLNIPGLLFGGALASALICAGINSAMLHKQSGAPENAYLPLRRWALPASATKGLLLITAVSLGMYLGGMQHGRVLFKTVYTIASVAFSVQALGSMARRLYASALKKRAQKAILVLIAAFSLIGASLYVALYGCASALMGQYGAMRQKMDDMNSNKE